MSDLGTAIYRAMTGRHHHTEVSTFQGALNWVMGRSGSKAAAARALGVAPSTLRGWLGGRKPRSSRSSSIVDDVRGLQRRVRMSQRRERKLRAAPARDIQITATITYSSTHETREVNIGRYLDPAVLDDLVDAYLDGAEPEQLAEIFHEAILDDGFYADTFDPNSAEDHWDIKEVWGWA